MCQILTIHALLVEFYCRHSHLSKDLQSKNTLLILAICACLLQDIGAGKGKYYAVNFPLRDGIEDDSYESIFKPVSYNFKKENFLTY